MEQKTNQKHKKYFICEIQTDDKSIEEYNKLMMTQKDNKNPTETMKQMLQYLEFLWERPMRLKKHFDECFVDDKKIKIKFYDEKFYNENLKGKK